MTIPGFNLYAMATRLIGKEEYTHFVELTRSVNARGISNSTFAAGVTLFDSIQPVPRTLYEKLGLDLSRYYVMVYTDNPLLVAERATGGDEIEYQSERYQLLSSTDWRPQDGWRGVLAIRLNATVSP